MNETPAKARSVIVEREIAHPPEKIWRALTQPHLIEEWLMKNDFAPAVGHRFNLQADQPNWKMVLDLRGPRRRAEQEAVLHLEFCERRCGPQPEKRGDLDPHTDERGDPSAHGTVGFSARSAAGLRGCQRRVAEVLCGP